MKKLFTLVAIAALALSAQAKVEVTHNGTDIANGETVKLGSEVFEEIPGLGYEFGERFYVDGATPIQLSVVSNSNKWSYCTDQCFTLADNGDGTYTHSSTINMVPQDILLDALFMSAASVPELDLTATFTLTDADDDTFAFTVNLNTIAGALNTVVNDAAEMSTVYNLQGMRMSDASTLPAGIYIRTNGVKAEKFIVK